MEGRLEPLEDQRVGVDVAVVVVDDAMLVDAAQHVVCQAASMLTKAC